MSHERAPAQVGARFITLLVCLTLLSCGDPPAAVPDASASGLDERVGYCLTGAACNVIAPRNLSACASAVDGPPLAVQRCIAAAGADCVAARACSFDATHPSLCAFGETPRCDGNVALTCDGVTTTTSQSDCTLTDEVCIAGATSARCARGTCAAPGNAHYCEGDVAAYCARPFLLGPDCAKLDATCVATDGGATCQGHGAGCIVPTCDGDTLVACLSAHRARIACRSDERCFPPSPNITLARCGLAADCDVTTHFDRCTGGVLSYCRRGRSESLDCRALGFADCQGSPSSGCVLTAVDDGGMRPLTDAFKP